MGINPMSKNNSLGSTPIGFQSSDTNYSFIRDLGLGGTAKATSQSKQEHNYKPRNEMRAVPRENTDVETATSVLNKNKQQQTSEKKIVSYYIEVDLVDRLKEMADESGDYYSSVASKAIRSWIERHGF